MKEYDPKEIEAKWQKEWEKSGIYNAENESQKPKYYTLIEFPYPSGDGLHVGHPRPYIGLDIISRKRRMEGYNVLYPIGWDAFGLPTENYAIKTGKNPRQVTKENTDTFRRQIQSLGISFDWSREINTTDPKYYKWTQWIFLKLLEHGLAYKAKIPVNWCPKDKIVLANEEVVDGKCERCGTPVEQKEKEQWMLAITKYADKLLEGLDNVDYPERVKVQQRNWIGRSEGAEISFEVDKSESLKVFTTRPDTIFGATFLVVAGKKDRFTGEYAINPATREKIPVWEAEYVYGDYGTGAIMAVPAHDQRDFDFAKKHDLPIKQVIEPVFENTTEQGKIKSELPIVERNSIMAIVKHWTEDKYIGLRYKDVDWKTFITGGPEEGQDMLEGAITEITQETGYLHLKFIKNLNRVHSKFFHIPKKINRFAHFTTFYFELQDGGRQEVSEEEKRIHEMEWLTKDEMTDFLSPRAHKYVWNSLFENAVYEGEGILANSGEFNGLNSDDAREKITKKFGEKIVKYKLRDWVFSRQRYWGEPIPVVHCEKCGIVPIPEEDLPVKLPEIENYQPTDTGESPLANITEWVNIKCPKCGGEAKRETDVMPNWAGSSWYYLAYLFNKEGFENPVSLENWKLQIENFRHFMPVDWYNGGMEHTVLHLLYSRFWNKFLYDIGVVPVDEPYKKRTSHGLILAEGGEKMSKSKGNVVNPDAIVDRFGADTLRLYEMFMGPFEQAIEWNDSSLAGPRRFLEKVCKLQAKVSKGQTLGTDSQGLALVHQTIKKISDDIDTMKFNTAISTLMILVNDLDKREKVSREQYETLLKLLAPFAPHMTEELWHQLGSSTSKSIHEEPWPTYDESRLVSDTVTLVVQVNGKVRAKFDASSDITEKEAIEKAESMPEVEKWIGDKKVEKRIYVPRKLVNIVVL